MKRFIITFCRIGQVLVTASISTATIWAIVPTPATAATFTLDSSNNNSGTFGLTGSIDAVNITTAGTYTIDAFGAEGGADGGLGGQVKANFTFAANTFLRILVGGRGFNVVGTGGGGGGGGTLVKNGNTLLIVAGGGGGGGISGGNGGDGFGGINSGVNRFPAKVSSLG